MASINSLPSCKLDSFAFVRFETGSKTFGEISNPKNKRMRENRSSSEPVVKLLTRFVSHYPTR